MADITWGSEVEFEAVLSSAWTRCCQIDTDKFVIVYNKANIGWAIVATVSDTTVSFGTAVLISTGSVTPGLQIDVCKLDTNKFVVVWADDGLADDGYARVGTVAGSTITFGTAVEFYDGDTEAVSCCQIDTDKFAICYNDEAVGDEGYVCICTVSDSTITPGTPVQFDANEIRETKCCPLGTDKLVAVYRRGDYRGWACVITVSGTTPSPGTPQKFDDTGNVAGFDCDKLDTDKFVVIWGNTTQTDGYVLVATVSGTVVTFGSFATLTYCTHNSIAAVDTTHFEVCVADRDNNTYGTSYYCSVAGTTITLGSAEVFHEVYSRYMSTCLIASGKVVAAYQDYDDADHHGIARAGTFTYEDLPPEEPKHTFRLDPKPRTRMSFYPNLKLG